MNIVGWGKTNINVCMFNMFKLNYIRANLVSFMTRTCDVNLFCFVSDYACGFRQPGISV